MPYITPDEKGVVRYETPDVTPKPWILIHDGINVIISAEAIGKINTMKNVFTGTEADVKTEIAKLKLKEKPVMPEIKVSNPIPPHGK